MEGGFGEVVVVEVGLVGLGEWGGEECVTAVFVEEAGHFFVGFFVGVGGGCVLGEEGGVGGGGGGGCGCESGRGDSV